MRRIGHPIALCVLALALAPASALAKSHHHRPKPPPAVQHVLNDCANHPNRLAHHYPLLVLQEALNDIPTDQLEYSTCATEIQNAIRAELGGTRPPPKASKAAKVKVAKNLPTELHQAQQAGSQPVQLGSGPRLAAGAIQVNGSSLLAALPTPILIVLAALIALGALPLALRLRSIVRARRSR